MSRVHSRCRFHPSKLAVAVAAVGLLATLHPAAAQSSRSKLELASGRTYPQEIRTTLHPELGALLERHTVWLHVPSSQRSAIDVELTVDGGPALLEVAVVPPIQKQVAPDSMARFDVVLDGRPSLQGGSFTLVFRNHANGSVLGEIPGGIERGVGAAPRVAKQAAIETLREIADEIRNGAKGVGDRDHALDEIEDSIEEIEESLDPEFWARVGDEIDPQRLDPERGAHVFREERHGSQEAFDAIRQGDIENQDIIDELVAISEALVAADRRLAEVAIQDAIDANGDPDDIEEAQDDLAEGIDLVQEAAEESNLRAKAALLYTAMNDAFRHSWDAAIDAVEDD